ncbi:MAG: coenzyme A pyrophosphatase [Gemmatimonadales bacterium]|nr:MAG: coenzyme A pyrophosphatase [Gemmatimonadales bacterium]
MRDSDRHKKTVTAITFDHLKECLAHHPPRRIAEPRGWQAAVALVLVPNTGREGLDLLLIKRAENPRDPWSGQMALPGGRWEPGDPSLLETAVRETREEVGLDLAPGQLLGELDDLEPRTRTLPQLVVRPFVFGLGSKPALNPSPEVALYLWVPLEELLAEGSRQEAEIPALGRSFPAYMVGAGYPVWGMTERILSRFLELVRPR